MDEVLAYLKENSTYFLATVDAEGNPQIRPFGTINLFEGRLYIQTGKSKAVFKELAAHPRAAISAMGKDNTWLRIEADFVDDDRVEAKAAMMEAYPHLAPMYPIDDPNTGVLYMENARARFCSFTDAPKEITF